MITVIITRDPERDNGEKKNSVATLPKSVYTHNQKSKKATPSATTNMNIKKICKFSNIYLVLWIILSVLKCNIVKGLGLIKSSTSNDSEKDKFPGEKITQLFCYW